MTNPLLARCQALGIRLEAEGDNLAIDTPTGSLTDDLLAEIRTNKPALLAALKKTTDRTATLSETAPEPETATSGEGEPVHVLDAWLDGQDLGQWTYANERLTGPDANPTDDFDSLPEPGPACPTCGSLDALWGLWGERICQKCNSSKLERSRRLAERAGRLEATG